MQLLSMSVWSCEWWGDGSAGVLQFPETRRDFVEAAAEGKRWFSWSSAVSWNRKRLSRSWSKRGRGSPLFYLVHIFFSSLLIQNLNFTDLVGCTSMWNGLSLQLHFVVDSNCEWPITKFSISITVITIAAMPWDSSCAGIYFLVAKARMAMSSRLAFNSSPLPNGGSATDSTIAETCWVSVSQMGWNFAYLTHGLFSILTS